MLRISHCLLVVALGAAACVHAPPHGAGMTASTRLLSADEHAATVAAAAQLFTFATDTVPVCVEFQDAVTRYSPDSTFVTALGPRARVRSDCPRTYASMIYNPDAPTRPPGYIDPYQLVLRRPASAEDGSLIWAQLWQGTAYTEYQCAVIRFGNAWKATCRETARGMS